MLFVVTGSKIDNLKNLPANVETEIMLLVVTLIAIASKLIGGFLGALSLGRRSATIVGFGMVPRGEVGVVVASLSHDRCSRHFTTASTRLSLPCRCSRR